MLKRKVLELEFSKYTETRSIHKTYKNKVHFYVQGTVKNYNRIIKVKEGSIKETYKTLH